VIAAIQLVLLIVAGIVLLGKQIAPHVHRAAAREAAAKPAKVSHPAAKPKASRTLAHAAPTLARAKTKVLVLNGNGVQGAAALAAQLAQARGYPVLDVGNALRTGYARTIVMYRPGFRSEALRFRHDLNLSVVAPLDGMRPAELKGAQLVEILGAAR
jgi:thiamine pyrophosphate-dependent acetolactate synthase large subunit-like protein